jgi:hypothetical protein
MKRLVRKSANVNIHEAIGNAIKKIGDIDSAKTIVNNFIEDILTAYDEELINDDYALYLLGEFEKNPNVDIFSIIDSEEEELVAASVKTADDEKDKTELEKFRDRLDKKDKKEKEDYDNLPFKGKVKHHFDKAKALYKEFFAEKLDDMVVIKVPSITHNRDENGKLIPLTDAERQKYINLTIELLNAAFFGSSSREESGTWLDDKTKENVVEVSETIYSYCSKKNLKAHEHEIVELCKEMKENLSQDSICLTMHGRTQFI